MIYIDQLALVSFIASHCNASLAKYFIAADNSFQFISQVCNFQDLRELFPLHLLYLLKEETQQKTLRKRPQWLV